MESATTWLVETAHLAIDAESCQIQAAILTEAGVHDAEVAPAMLQQVTCLSIKRIKTILNYRLTRWQKMTLF